MDDLLDLFFKSLLNPDNSKLLEQKLEWIIAYLPQVKRVSLLAFKAGALSSAIGVINFCMLTANLIILIRKRPS